MRGEGGVGGQETVIVRRLCPPWCQSPKSNNEQEARRDGPEDSMQSMLSRIGEGGRRVRERREDGRHVSVVHILSGSSLFTSQTKGRSSEMSMRWSKRTCGFSFVDDSH
jgi:hypothetical protein